MEGQNGDQKQTDQELSTQGQDGQSTFASLVDIIDIFEIAKPSVFITKILLINLCLNPKCPVCIRSMQM